MPLIDALEPARRVLVLLLMGAGLLIGALVVALALRRAYRAAARRRRDALLRIYQPAVDDLLRPDTASAAMTRLLSSPYRHRAVIGQALLAPLRVAGGEAAEYVRAVSASLGLRDVWRTQLDDRRWWVRAEAARALGLVRDRQSVGWLVAALADPHDEVRAAAAVALGGIGDASALPDLVAALGNPARHQRSRIVDALGRFGGSVAPVLADHARRRPADAPHLIEMLGLVGGTGHAGDLIGWTSDARADVRAAAVGALGALGLDDRSYYFALRALGDEAAEVRAAAARALARSRRTDAVPYLAARLDDEWGVAAQSAWALRQLGPAGHQALAARASDAGGVGELARHVLRGTASPATESAR